MIWYTQLVPCVFSMLLHLVEATPTVCPYSSVFCLFVCFLSSWAFYQKLPRFFFRMRMRMRNLSSTMAEAQRPGSSPRSGAKVTGIFSKCETSYKYKAASKNRATTVKTNAGEQEKGFEEYLACDPLAGYPTCEMFELHTVDGDDVWYVVKNQIVMTFSEFRPVFLSWIYSPLSPFVHSSSTGQIDYATVCSIFAKWHLWPLHWTFRRRRGNSYILYIHIHIYYT